MHRIISLFLLITTIFSAGCFNNETPVEKANKEKILLVGNNCDPRNLDPQLTTTLPEHRIMTALFEGLVTMDAQTLKIIPGIAESWEVQKDQKTYIFKLRENLKWSNGDPLTAEDFVRSYMRILDPLLASENTSLLHVIDGAQEYNSGSLTNFDKVGVKALDDRLLEIKLKEVTPYFLSLLTKSAWAPVHTKNIERCGSLTSLTNNWSQPENHISNGPFIVKEWKNNNYILLVKNPYYWNIDNVKLNGIKFFPISSSNTEERAFRGNALHITETVPYQKKSVYIKESDPHFKTHPCLGTEYYILNTNIEALKDKRVRKALSISINRNEISNRVISPDYHPAHHLVPPNLNNYKSTYYIQENIEEARNLMAEAGFPDGEGFPKLELLYNTADKNQHIAEAVQQMWKKNLGIQVDLINQEAKVCFEKRKDRQFQILRASWIGDYLDPSTFLDIFKQTSYNNYSDWNNETYDTLTSEAAQTLDINNRMELLAKAESILLEETPIIPVHFYSASALVKDNVKGYYPNILDFHPFQEIDLD